MRQKTGQPFLYDDTTGDMVGVKDADGGEFIFSGATRKGDGSHVVSDFAKAAHAAEHVAMGQLVSGEWTYIPSIFRLQMTGTGTVTLDSRDALGTITTGVYSVTLSGATNEIGFPYAGDAAVAIRATLTGSATAKVI